MGMRWYIQQMLLWVEACSSTYSQSASHHPVPTSACQAVVCAAHTQRIQHHVPWA